jgi:hypothetical protein
MNMHPKPALRHTRYVEPFDALAFHDGHLPVAEPYRVRFTRKSDGATQLLTMTRDECFVLYGMLATMLKFENVEIADATFVDGFIADLKEIVRCD